MHRINSKLIVGGPENQVTVSIKEQKEMGTMLSVRELILAPHKNTLHWTQKDRQFFGKIINGILFNNLPWLMILLDIICCCYFDTMQLLWLIPHWQHYSKFPWKMSHANSISNKHLICDSLNIFHLFCSIWQQMNLWCIGTETRRTRSQGRSI